MSFLGKLELESKQYALLKCEIRISRLMDGVEHPKDAPSKSNIIITLIPDDSGSNELLVWSTNQNMCKNGQVVLFEKDNTVFKAFSFRNAQCINYLEEFRSDKIPSVQIKMTISANEIKQEFTGLRENLNNCHLN